MNIELERLFTFSPKKFNVGGKNWVKWLFNEKGRLKILLFTQNARAEGSAEDKWRDQWAFEDKCNSGLQLGLESMNGYLLVHGWRRIFNGGVLFDGDGFCFAHLARLRPARRDRIAKSLFPHTWEKQEGNPIGDNLSSGRVWKGCYRTAMTTARKQGQVLHTFVPLSSFFFRSPRTYFCQGSPPTEGNLNEDFVSTCTRTMIGMLDPLVSQTERKVRPAKEALLFSFKAILITR